MKIYKVSSQIKKASEIKDRWIYLSGVDTSYAHVLIREEDPETGEEREHNGTLEYSVSPEEKATHDYPGAEAEVEIGNLILNGKIMPIDLSSFQNGQEFEVALIQGDYDMVEDLKSAHEAEKHRDRGDYWD
jgi:hypothetical protein